MMMRPRAIFAASLFLLALGGHMLIATECSRAATIVLQPGSEGKDSHVCNLFGWSETNFGASEWYQVIGLISNAAAFIEFDLSAIPAGSTIDLATIALWAEYQDGQIYFEPAAASWDEMTVTWNNQPAALMPSISWPISRGDPSGPCYWGCTLTFDITGIVQYWIDHSNFGLRITADTPGLGWMMASSDNLAKPRPALTVSYTEGVGTEPYTWGGIKSLFR
jgi:hypothetical protein